MTVFAGGLAALVLGIIGIITWWGDFIGILKGALPIMLILVGALAAYLGYEEIKDKSEADEKPHDSEEKLKKEIESLKEELDELKKEDK